MMEIKKASGKKVTAGAIVKQIGKKMATMHKGMERAEEKMEKKKGKKC